MKKIFYIISSIVLIAFFSSCEEVIDIDLNTSNPKLVIESGICKDSVCTTRLSYTNNYFAIEDDVLENNAIVSITDSDGNTEILTSIGDGIYVGNTIIGIPGITYTLNVEVNDQTYTASSRMGMGINDLTIDYSTFDLFGFQSDTLFSINTHFFDADPETEDFYLIKTYTNGEDLDPSSYNLLSDKPSSGDTIMYNPFYYFFEEYDTVDIEVISIDESVYMYYNDLNNALSGGMMGSATPYNPISNFGHGKLGYFSAYNPIKAQIVTSP